MKQGREGDGGSKPRVTYLWSPRRALDCDAPTCFELDVLHTGWSSIYAIIFTCHPIPIPIIVAFHWWSSVRVAATASRCATLVTGHDSTWGWDPPDRTSDYLSSLVRRNKEGGGVAPFMLTSGQLVTSVNTKFEKAARKLSSIFYFGLVRMRRPNQGFKGPIICPFGKHTTNQSSPFSNLQRARVVVCHNSDTSQL